MDSADTHTAPPLHDLLGASFVFNATIGSLAWDGDVACFGLADGALAMLHANWPGAPYLAPRPGGGLEIIPCAAPPPPPLIVQAHSGAVLALARDPLGGVVSGGADGRCLRIAEGEVAVVAERKRRRIGMVAAGRGGRRAFAVGRQVHQLGPEPRRLNMPAQVTALAYDPSGLHLAIGYDGGVSLAACAIRQCPLREAPGAHLVLCWSPDGTMIAVARPQGGVSIRVRAEAEWRDIEAISETMTSMCFTSDDSLVMANSAGARLWRDGSAVQEMIVGFGGRQVVAPVACHPRLGLVACADNTGGILLCRPGLRAPIVIREAGAAPMVLAFAPDGEALAFGAEDGEAGTVLLPDSLFRRGETQ